MLCRTVPEAATTFQRLPFAVVADARLRRRCPLTDSGRRTPRLAAKAFLMAVTLAASLSSSRRRPRLNSLLFRSREPSEHPLSYHSPFEFGENTVIWNIARPHPAQGRA